MKKIGLLISAAVFLFIAASYLYLGTTEKKFTYFMEQAPVLTSALIVNGTHFTLNLDQHEKILRVLNRSEKIPAPHLSPYHSPYILELYTTEKPIKFTALDKKLKHFNVTTQTETFYIKIKKNKDLQTILDGAYDL